MSYDELTKVEELIHTVKQKYAEQSSTLSTSDQTLWSSMVSELNKVALEMDQLLQRNQKQMNVSFLLNNETPKILPKLDRTAFYSENSPYQHQTDKSGSFRLCPPLAHTTAAEYFRNDANVQLQLTDGQILENLSNLKRLADLHNRR
ncbi:hypothetical protein KLMA_60105 [Kluyveromyces marxianus]|uniref:Uncharacterized protein n=2 Tax=Kluyveromyces marxianus TaxID=4911 RepID=W0TF22_KLUMD|nr:hypothetical protein KLMA_60105 [Kluyveromyces marxianus DMKU3-1042]QGN17459.1 hypothetical protein FIM1_4193 [Kluyveromyces marxianus]BAO41396.1 hypothetical protein KLMA_60105 [Kluyveromyces marxianus DMKU3-1042]BAP72844.1 hypothetical protein KLMA_60105 [Kluyveromyces marxianus]